MGRKGYGLFEESALLNNVTYMQYFNRLTELAISMFEWQNLPPTVDPRYLELHLFQNGCMVYFNDDVIGNLCLDCLPNGNFDVYGNPVNRRAYSSYNNYQRDLKEDDSVIIGIIILELILLGILKCTQSGCIYWTELLM